jgi:hypothetical protein
MYVLLDSLQEHTLLPLTLYAPPPSPAPPPHMLIHHATTSRRSCARTEPAWHGPAYLSSLVPARPWLLRLGCADLPLRPRLQLLEALPRSVRGLVMVRGPSAHRAQPPPSATTPHPPPDKHGTTSRVHSNYGGG